ncbi:hypothetical protein AUEXF2481DRAFT_291205 [Aureobasidium subglaciale EXF-2481]|uniref:Uncharacterized protein n=1 Tax=Aureobasidium subglaciale (strain EXF-2481) TaxID=1043005 RepID=A0A074YJ00_AURSE|nr:uncharacterized protein AUEXF2481DRAFT_291205 [Aureobasidium subglaciale EXF-2481]KAI5208436.1 hypothetical protein E4T38_02952 [Aureobasidium subglaciale]KAI5227335.1 hypothetical protein E4T40_02611 [Aureobasidium subglaciale]KAI5230587.1 hypothetical protein E4T41_02951 [Aureobasidium subglaciale]KAI5265017.1 hypothetical protein E4T46_02729 [Aureobasidium subglaciale]KEQ94057.1 hypothetical protein AUEXF2481DRAFT_291205 [Aureobasidium subglaciale EXF-2481]
MATLDTPPSIPSPTIPPYLTLLTQFLFGLTATSNSTLLFLFSSTWGIYWIYSIAVYKYAGAYLDVYITGCTMFSVVVRILAVGVLGERGFERKKKDDGEEDKGKEVGKEGNQKRGLLQRVWDAVEVGCMGARGIGWTHQLRNLPPAPPASSPRIPFAIRNLASAVFNLLLVDLAHHHLRHNSPITSPPLAQLSTQPLPLALLNAWLIYLQARWTMTALYSLLAVFTVPLHVFAPVHSTNQQP